MRRTIRGLLVVAALVGAASQALGMPGGNGKGNGNGGGSCDAVAIAQAQTLLDASCDCAAATRHGEYVSCVAHAVRDAVRAGTIARSCKGLLKKGAARSTCGKPGAVACCRTAASGRTKCSIKSSAAACTPPDGGTACVSPSTSCLDACTTSGCAASPSGAFLDAVSF
jgi:hypothetical protein